MKNAIIAILLSICVESCKKKQDEKSGRVTFYQMEYYSTNIHLFVNNDHIQPLPTAKRIDSSYVPHCGANLWPCVKTIDLPYGKHTFFLKDVNETITDTITFQVDSDCQVIKIE